MLPGAVVWGQAWGAGAGIRRRLKAASHQKGCKRSFCFTAIGNTYRQLGPKQIFRCDGRLRTKAKKGATALVGPLSRQGRHGINGRRRHRIGRRGGCADAILWSANNGPKRAIHPYRSSHCRRSGACCKVGKDACGQALGHLILPIGVGEPKALFRVGEKADFRQGRRHL